MCRCDTVDLIFINPELCVGTDWGQNAECCNCYFKYECDNWLYYTRMTYKSIFFNDYQMIYSEGE